ncbi:hypothetical protein BGZ60DRAFT_222746 [Tricladium varicosporioides]|nr:hypothetical protein BGZ60DRAFT_222746 [Hymenoscyphus varicosporioides]
MMFSFTSSSTTSHKSNKPRLYIALYARPKHPSSPHFALLVAPKSSIRLPTTIPIFKFHVKNTLLVNEDGVPSSPWRMETEDFVDLRGERNLLVLVMVGKVLVGVDEVERCLRGVKIVQEGEQGEGSEERFSCVTWSKHALGVLKDKGLDSREWRACQFGICLRRRKGLYKIHETGRPKLNKLGMFGS